MYTPSYLLKISCMHLTTYFYVYILLSTCVCTLLSTEDSFYVKTSLSTEDSFCVSTLLSTEDSFYICTLLSTDDRFYVHTLLSTEDSFNVCTWLSTEDMTIASLYAHCTLLKQLSTGNGI